MNSDYQFKPGDLIEVFDSSVLANRAPYPVIHPHNGEKGVVIKTSDMSVPESTSAFDSLMTAITGQWLVDCLLSGKVVSIEPEYLRKL